MVPVVLEGTCLSLSRIFKKQVSFTLGVLCLKVRTFLLCNCGWDV